MLFDIFASRLIFSKKSLSDHWRIDSWGEEPGCRWDARWMATPESGQVMLGAAEVGGGGLGCILKAELITGWW